jgi:hypothetical protein
VVLPCVAGKILIERRHAAIEAGAIMVAAQGLLVPSRRIHTRFFRRFAAARKAGVGARRMLKEIENAGGITRGKGDTLMAGDGLFSRRKSGA